MDLSGRNRVSERVRKTSGSERRWTYQLIKQETLTRLTKDSVPDHQHFFHVYFLHLLLSLASFTRVCRSVWTRKPSLACAFRKLRIPSLHMWPKPWVWLTFCSQLVWGHVVQCSSCFDMLCGKLQSECSCFKFIGLIKLIFFRTAGWCVSRRPSSSSYSFFKLLFSSLFCVLVQLRFIFFLCLILLFFVFLYNSVLSSSSASVFSLFF